MKSTYLIIAVICFKVTKAQDELFEDDIDPPKSTFRFAKSYRFQLWNDGTVPFVMDSAFSDEQRTVIRNQMYRLTRETQCIRFVARKTEKDYLFIKKNEKSPALNIKGRRGFISTTKIGTFDTACHGCSSVVGKSGDQQVTNLASKCIDKPGIVLHELMHVLGFLHEHNRPDRDEHVTVVWDNLRQSSWWNFRVCTTEGMTTYGLPYDYLSLMHYGEYYFSIEKNVKKTVIPKQEGVAIGQREYLSQLDIKKIKAMCKVSGFKPKSCEEAMTAAGYGEDNTFPIYVGPDGEKAITLYCRKMADGRFADYVTLKVINIAWNKNDAPDPNWGRYGLTKFDKIRINPSTLEVYKRDFVFATSVPAGRDVSFGEGGGCRGWKQTSGSFNIDLTDTGFYIPESQKWKAVGYFPVSTVTRLTPDGTVVQGQCGGYCGHCVPVDNKITLAVL